MGFLRKTWWNCDKEDIKVAAKKNFSYSSSFEVTEP